MTSEINMDACLAVEKEVQKVNKNQLSFFAFVSVTQEILKLRCYFPPSLTEKKLSSFILVEYMSSQF